MVSEEVCNYFMGGFLVLIWIYKFALILLVIGLLRSCWTYWVDRRYGLKNIDEKQLRRIFDKIKKELRESKEKW